MWMGISGPHFAFSALNYDAETGTETAVIHFVGYSCFCQITVQQMTMMGPNTEWSKKSGTPVLILR